MQVQGAGCRVPQVFSQTILLSAEQHTLTQLTPHVKYSTPCTYLKVEPLFALLFVSQLVLTWSVLALYLFTMHKSDSTAVYCSTLTTPVTVLVRAY